MEQIIIMIAVVSWVEGGHARKRGLMRGRDDYSTPLSNKISNILISSILNIARTQ
jgi:hypothetical protein